MLNWLNTINLNILFMVAGGILLLMLLPKPIEFLLKLTSQGVVGLLAILGLNFMLMPLEVGIGVNVITLGVATLLGIPGVVSLYILEVFL